MKVLGSRVSPTTYGLDEILVIFDSLTSYKFRNVISTLFRSSCEHLIISGVPEFVSDETDDVVS